MRCCARTRERARPRARASSERVPEVARARGSLGIEPRSAREQRGRQQGFTPNHQNSSGEASILGRGGRAEGVASESERARESERG
eukprot:1527178-Pleurochrysis_carterae.AAC.2